MLLRETVRTDCQRFAELSGGPSSKASIGLTFHPRVFPVVLVRVAAKFHSMGLSRMASAVALMNMLIFRIEVPARAAIGRGLVLPHPGGIILGSASIGDDVTIFQNVTLGARQFDGDYNLSRRPVLQSRVTVGAGAVILGPVTIGEGATVAANSLVLADVPPGYTAMGVPAINSQKVSKDPDISVQNEA
jgi:serine O-acetyltransferase